MVARGHVDGANCPPTSREASREVDRKRGLEEAFTVMDATAFTGRNTLATMLAAQGLVKTRGDRAGHVRAITSAQGLVRNVAGSGELTATSFVRCAAFCSFGVRGHRKPLSCSWQSATTVAVDRGGTSLSTGATLPYPWGVP